MYVYLYMCFILIRIFFIPLATPGTSDSILYIHLSSYLSRRTKEHMNDLWILDQDSWRWDQIIPFGAPAPNPRYDFDPIWGN